MSRQMRCGERECGDLGALPQRVQGLVGPSPGKAAGSAIKLGLSYLLGQGL